MIVNNQIIPVTLTCSCSCDTCEEYELHVAHGHPPEDRKKIEMVAEERSFDEKYHGSGCFDVIVSYYPPGKHENAVFSLAQLVTRSDIAQIAEKEALIETLERIHLFMREDIDKHEKNCLTCKSYVKSEQPRKPNTPASD